MIDLFLIAVITGVYFLATVVAVLGVLVVRAIGRALAGPDGEEWQQ